MSKPTVISTFSGPGGSSLGYERAGYDVRVALDNAPNKFSNTIPETYRRNHSETIFLEQDARNTTRQELLDAADLEVGELDILDGSPPCSPFSSSNTQKAWGDHESGTLFDRYVYFVDELQPRVFIAENVPDLAQGKTKGYYKQLCENLRDAGPGYNLTVQKIDAAYLGAAHHRRRLIFIGIRNDIGTPPTIEPTQRPTTVREAWEGLDRDPDAIERVKKRLERSDNYENYCKMAPGQSLDDIVDGAYGFTHHRLSYRKPAPTIPSGGGSSNVILPPDEDRWVTIDELKRLIGVPDCFELPNNYNSAFECTVRCLPPVLLETIAERLQDGVLKD